MSILKAIAVGNIDGHPAAGTWHTGIQIGVTIAIGTNFYFSNGSQPIRCPPPPTDI